MNDIRVRFAPSPTGPLHIGGLRTALYNFLFARKHQGTFFLRIEDTDQNRFVEGAEKYILDSLDWCQIGPDEGPAQGGPFGPYRQSERKEIYREHALDLIEQGKAYYAFDTASDLEAMREKLKAAKVAALHYNSITRNGMINSLTLSEEETRSRIESGESYVIRLKIPSKEEVRFKDLIRGWVKIHSSTLDDKILLKSDGMPTYHLANIVDDHLMQVTHVIRGEEWLPSAPLHILLYDLFGWKDTMPQFAHLPLLLKPDGNGKLSKRDGDKHGFPIFPLEWTDPETLEKVLSFREEGYIPEAFTNFLALLGWNPGGENELFTLDELVNEFSLEKVSKAGAKFDIEKAKWFNEQYLRKTSIDSVVAQFSKMLSQKGIQCSPEKATRITELLIERVTFSHEMWEKGQYFFKPPEVYDQKIASKRWNRETVQVLVKLSQVMERIEPFETENIRKAIMSSLEDQKVQIGGPLQALRLGLTGLGGGPDLMSIIEIIGKDQALKRIELAQTRLIGYLEN